MCSLTLGLLMSRSGRNPQFLMRIVEWNRLWDLTLRKIFWLSRKPHCRRISLKPIQRTQRPKVCRPTDWWCSTQTTRTDWRSTPSSTRLNSWSLTSSLYKTTLSSKSSICLTIFGTRLCWCKALKIIGSPPYSTLASFLRESSIVKSRKFLATLLRVTSSNRSKVLGSR